MKDAPETNKFKGLTYYAIDKRGEIIAEGSNPDTVYRHAIIAGETCPSVVRGRKFTKKELRKLKLEKIERCSGK